MKPCNFPGNKNGRRMDALMRLQANDPDNPEIKTLRERIIDQQYATEIKTKKYRGADWRRKEE